MTAQPDSRQDITGAVDAIVDVAGLARTAIRTTTIETLGPSYAWLTTTSTSAGLE